MNSSLNSNWYQELFNDLKGLEFSLIIQKWKIGERITTDLLKFKRAEYGSKTLNNLADDLKVSKSHLYYCIQFYKKYPNFQQVGELGAYSWKYIIKNLLPINPKEREDKPNQELKEPIKNFISEKIALWKQGDLRFKKALEENAKNKIKFYRLLLNHIKKLKGGLTNGK